jgi:hypothetical protein
MPAARQSVAEQGGQVRAPAAIVGQLGKLGQGEGGVHVGQLGAPARSRVVRQEPLEPAAARQHQRAGGGGNCALGRQRHDYHLTGAAGRRGKGGRRVAAGRRTRAGAIAAGDLTRAHAPAAGVAHGAERSGGDILDHGQAKLTQDVERFGLPQWVMHHQRHRFRSLLRFGCGQPPQPVETQRAGIGIDLHQHRSQPEPPGGAHVAVRHQRGHQHPAGAAAVALLVAGGHRLQRRPERGAFVGHSRAAEQAQPDGQLAHQPARQSSRPDRLRHQTFQHCVHLPAADRGAKQRYRLGLSIAGLAHARAADAGPPDMRLPDGGGGGAGLPNARH